MSTTFSEKMSKIRVAVLQISSHLGIGHAQVAAGHARGKNDFFFGNVPNGSIRKVNWLKSKFEHLLQNLPITGGHRPSLRNFSAENENTVLAHLIDFGWFDLSDIAYSVR